MSESGQPADGGDRPASSRRSRRGIGGISAGFLGSLIDYIDTRVRLFQLEAREARGALIRRIVCAIAGALFLVVAYAGLLIGGVALIAAHWEKPWHLVTLWVAGGHLAAGVLLLLAAKARLRKHAFRDTREELKKDREWLNEISERD